MITLAGLKLAKEAVGGAIGIVPKIVWEILAVLILLLGAKWYLGHTRDEWYEKGRTDLAEEMEQKNGQLTSKSEAVTHSVEVKIVERIKYVEKAGAVIIQKVPVYVTKEDDSRCVIPNSFVQLWDDSNEANFSRSPEDIARGDSNLTLSQIGEQKAEEATTCLRLEEQNRGWKEWYREQQLLYRQ